MYICIYREINEFMYMCMYYVYETVRHYAYLVLSGVLAYLIMSHLMIQSVHIPKPQTLNPKPQTPNLNPKP